MGSGFEISPDFEKQLARAVEPALQDVAARLQVVLDSMRDRYKGRPIAEIVPVLKREFARFGGSMSDREVQKYATAISNGIAIQTRVGS
ncbi:hypothetical protein [Mycolicibacterium helvum]|uniref:Uncharacterized protein n=1 Tax=Mycolicibacterium helvum TaxID=1534349 RepID=A0A7I7T894_9MYCO|nr:hypothetical protein [Mycolicibacterium helvum]BBY65494.1 hypothetical protein MHEL_37370 [Mycolicibacterium helvum]